MKRRAQIHKSRPAHWADSPEVGRHSHLFGITDLVERGRELSSTTLPNGPKPVPMRSKQKYRGTR